MTFPFLVIISPTPENSGPCNSFYGLGHSKNVHDDDDDDDEALVANDFIVLHAVVKPSARLLHSRNAANLRRRAPYLPYRVSGLTLTKPSGVLGCWLDGLELTPGFYPRSNEQHRLFQASTQNVLVRALLVHPAQPLSS